jgi:hypothetical protein
MGADQKESIMAETEEADEWEVVGPATAFDEQMVTWAIDTFKKNLEVLNSGLQRLVAFNTTLIGGSIFLLHEKPLQGPFQILATLFFLVSLAVAFWGTMPYESLKVSLFSPPCIARKKEEAMRWKQKVLWIAGSFMALGFLVFLIGFMVQALRKI